jgi:hypothetical protein
LEFLLASGDKREAKIAMHKAAVETIYGRLTISILEKDDIQT